MCPLCLATGTLALVSAGSAGSIGAIAAKVLQGMRKRESDVAHPHVDLAPEESPQRRTVRVAYIGGDPFNASSGGL